MSTQEGFTSQDELIENIQEAMEKKDIETIQKWLKAFHKIIKNLGTSYLYLLIGMTGVGKTTFANFMNGYQITKKILDGIKSVYEAVEGSSIEQLGQIGHNLDSQTLYLQKLGAFLDAPGFEDNRGKITKALTTLSVRIALWIANFRGIAAFIDYRSLGAQRGQSLKALLNQISSIFKSIDDVKDSVSFFFTNVPRVDPDLDKEIDVPFLKKKLENIRKEYEAKGQLNEDERQQKKVLDWMLDENKEIIHIVRYNENDQEQLRIQFKSVLNSLVPINKENIKREMDESFEAVQKILDEIRNDGIENFEDLKDLAKQINELTEVIGQISQEIQETEEAASEKEKDGQIHLEKLIGELGGVSKKVDEITEELTKLEEEIPQSVQRTKDLIQKSHNQKTQFIEEENRIKAQISSNEQRMESKRNEISNNQRLQSDLSTSLNNVRNEQQKLALNSKSVSEIENQISQQQSKLQSLSSQNSSLSSTKSNAQSSINQINNSNEEVLVDTQCYTIDGFSKHTPTNWFLFIPYDGDTKYTFHTANISYQSKTRLSRVVVNDDGCDLIGSKNQQLYSFNACYKNPYSSSRTVTVYYYSKLGDSAEGKQKIQQLEYQMNQSATQLQNQQIKQGSIEKEIQSLKNQKSTQERIIQQNQSLSQQISSLSNQVNSITSKNQNLQSEINQYSSSLSTLRSQLEAKRKAQSQQANEMSQEIQKTEQNTLKLQEQKAQKKPIYEQLCQEKSSLEKQIDVDQTQHGADLKAIEATRNNLIEKRKEKTQDLNGLKEKRQDVEEKIEKNIHDYTVLKEVYNQIHLEQEEENLHFLSLLEEYNSSPSVA